MSVLDRGVDQKLLDTLDTAPALPHVTSAEALRPSGVRLAALGLVCANACVSVMSDELASSLLGWPHDVCCAQVSPNGRLVITGGLDGTVRVWDAVRGQALPGRRGGPGRVTAVAIAPAGVLAASASVAGCVRVWDLARALELMCFQHGHAVTRLHFTATSEHLITAREQGGDVRVWDLRLRCEVGAVPAAAALEQLAAQRAA